MSKFKLFSVVGLEIEYMLVDKETLDIVPIADQIIEALAGKIINEIAIGDIAVSNELVMHVLELKNNGPRPITESLDEAFYKAIQTLSPILDAMNIRFLPTAAHPWMNPYTETKRWPYDNEAIYRQYDSIFDCRGHGWSNLQSMHINFPYADELEFFKLHNTIRLLLPLLPAIAASSPYLEGRATGHFDSRLEFYGQNQQKIPSISGHIIPEFVNSSKDYQEQILAPMYQEIAPYDPEGVLQYEWLNSRGAIPKFGVQAIEIRLLDSQECVKADYAIARFCQAILEEWLSQSEMHLERPCSTESLVSVYHLACQQGLAAIIEDKQVLRQWQLPERTMTLKEVFELLIERGHARLDLKSQQVLLHFLKQGSLSERLLAIGGRSPTHQQLRQLYGQVADCLIHNELLGAV